ncbi:hypothetical protein HGP28_02060 [Vibrio sp. SM6]|uniref:Uncharacterized protein n=1 Tax=Vibrio agarilyticus TaxID=2726741 RepID=A0A7X8TMV4_9VIBR|nr:hypothetical protein [Vibrio agarilyticus]NLS11673.1 hypothetical protein [Vibrio agarilyticus]
MAFERVTKVPTPEFSDISSMAKSSIFVQATNKKKQCKISIEPFMAAQENAQIYWDGSCKDGYADGLGRRIVISDQMHHESIITLRNGKTSDGTVTIYDRIHNTVLRGKNRDDSDVFSGQIEWITDNGVNFDVQQFYGVRKNNEAAGVYTSPFFPQSTYTYTKNNLTTGATDFRHIPTELALRVFQQNATTRQFGGVMIESHKNGAIHHFLHSASTPQNVIIPEVYRNELGRQLDVAHQSANQAQVDYQQSLAQEKVYLYKVCQNEKSMDGLSDAIYRMVCDFDKYQDKFQAAMVRGQQAIAQLHQQYNQRQQLALQQRQVAALESQAAAAHQSNSIQQSHNTNMLFQNNQTNLMNMINNNNNNLMEMNNRMFQSWGKGL